MKQGIVRVTGLALAGGVTLCSSVGAQELISLHSITISADKVEQQLEDVPASIAVISGEDLEQEGIQSLEQLEGRIPGLSFQPFGQSGLNSPVMRGLTANFNTFSTSTLLVVDGVPVMTPQGFEDSLLDVERVEVLRGPQSTLYGRNAEAGVIAIHSQPMDNTPRASVSAELGSRHQQGLRFSMSRPLKEDILYASISGSWSQQDGYVSNQLTDKKDDDRRNRHLKLGLRWTPQAATDVVLRFAHQRYRDGANPWGSPSMPERQTYSGTEGWNHSSMQSLSLNAAHTLASGLRLRSITAWNDVHDDIRQDTDFMPADITHIQRDHRLRGVSQELRLEGQLASATWLAALYVDRNDHDLHNIGRRMMMLDRVQAKQKTRSVAAYTNWQIPLSSAVNLVAGARIEQSKVHMSPQGSDSRQREWTHFLPKLALDYEYIKGQHWYVSVSRGIRAGGFNVLSAQSAYAPYEPEENWSYETGLKGNVLGQRLRYSATAYYMNIDNMQVMQMPRPAFMYITSAATAHSKGLELDVDYLLGQGWQWRAGLAWNRTSFARFQDGAMDYAGKRNPFAPEFTGHMSVRYDAASGWYAQLGVVGTSKVYLDAANAYQRNGYGMVNVTAGYQFGDWEIAAYGRNIANKNYDAVGYQNGFVTVYSPPREYGLRLSWRM